MRAGFVNYETLERKNAVVVNDNPPTRCTPRIESFIHSLGSRLRSVSNSVLRGGHEHGVRLILYFSMCRLLLVFGFKWKDFIVWKVPAFLVP